MKGNAKVTVAPPSDGTILIPELEEAIEKGLTGKFGNTWSVKEDAIMRRYYARVDSKILAKYLPGKTISQIQSKASRMGIATGGKR